MNYPREIAWQRADLLLPDVSEPLSHFFGDKIANFDGRYLENEMYNIDNNEYDFVQYKIIYK